MVSLPACLLCNVFSGMPVLSSRTNIKVKPTCMVVLFHDVISRFNSDILSKIANIVNMVNMVKNEMSYKE